MEQETKLEQPTQNEPISNRNKLSIPMAIIIVGILIAGAIYFSFTAPKNNNTEISVTTLAPIRAEDNMLGNPNAKVALIIYADYQCSFCGAISGFNTPLIDSLKQRDPNWTPFMPEIINNYIKNGNLLFVHRDWAFLGPQSTRAAEAAKCAGDQNKFWEYHNFLYSRQDQKGNDNFSDSNLKSYAKNLNLNTAIFDECFDSNKYLEYVTNSRDEGTKAGVAGTPKGFILKDGKIVGTIDGAESFSTVKVKIDNALK